MNQNAWTIWNHRKHKILGNTGIWVAPHQTLTAWRCLKSCKSVCPRRIFSSLCPLWTDLEHKKRRVKKKSFSSWSSVELSRFRCVFRAVRRETMSRLQHCPPPFYSQDRTLCKLGGTCIFLPPLPSLCASWDVHISPWILESHPEYTMALKGKPMYPPVLQVSWRPLIYPKAWPLATTERNNVSLQGDLFWWDCQG